MALQGADLYGGRSFGALLNRKFDALPLAQGAEPFRDYGRMMDKNVLLSAIAFDKTEPLTIVEPFYSASLAITHGGTLLLHNKKVCL
jgi:hypothetical protein